MGEEEHQVEVAEDVYDIEGVVDVLCVLLHPTECILKIPDGLLNLQMLIRRHEYQREGYGFLWGLPQNDSIFDYCFTVYACEHEVDESNNHHAFQSWIDRMLEDIEVAIVLRPPFNISLGIEPIRSLNVYLTSRLAAENLVWRAHFEKASTGVVVTVIDSFDNSFYFWCLNEVKDLKLYCNFERISAGEILLEDDGGQVMLIIDWFNVLDDHDSDVLHQLSAEEAQTEEFLC